MDSPFYWGYWEGPKCIVPEVLSNFVWYSQGWARLTSGALRPKSWQLPPVLRKSFGLFLLESLRISPSSRMRGRGLMANIPYLEGIASSLRWIQVSLKAARAEVVASMQQKERPV
ncbi:hypothetical protein CK203_025702 [Vitis vinifera]|uniref:Uncharacterized protein n=1 Tax=Vitis vinifera TaxID=29760 RepID=A0A438IGE3_VITVI|nr:hypothetical protein CK203_025702 [Vitis vinifera]